MYLVPFESPIQIRMLNCSLLKRCLPPKIELEDLDTPFLYALVLKSPLVGFPLRSYYVRIVLYM